MRRVIKVGGSLLNRVGLTAALSSWIDQQQPAENLIVVGGGSLVDAIRDLDAVRPLDPVATHWTCVDLLDTTFRILAGWTGWGTVADASELHHAIMNGFPMDGPTLVAVRSFYDRSQPGVAATLPQTWQTTSDSIAALLARRVAADELAILKSCTIAPGWTLDQLAAEGIVDEAFPRMASGLSRLRIEPLSFPVERDERRAR